MRYIKEFEKKTNVEISRGDYVLMNYTPSHKTLIDLSNFINNTIGIVSKISDDFIYVKYDAVPITLQRFFDKTNEINCRMMYIEDIVDFAKSKEELELKLQANKYNL